MQSILLFKTCAKERIKYFNNSLSCGENGVKKNMVTKINISTYFFSIECFSFSFVVNLNFGSSPLTSHLKEKTKWPTIFMGIWSTRYCYINTCITLNRKLNKIKDLSSNQMSHRAGIETALYFLEQFSRTEYSLSSFFILVMQL